MENKKRIHFYTNLVKEGWSANSLEVGVGGSEEMLIQLAKELAKDKNNEVTVYHNGEHGVFDGVFYRDHTEFKSFMTRDVFVSYKVKDIWSKSVGAKTKIHWTTEIEGEWKPFELDNVNEVFTISNYHTSRMTTKHPKIKTMYNWADLERLDKNKVVKESGTMLYCSSFDRGMEELLTNWEKIKKELNLKKLYITYGWDFIDKIMAFNPQLHDWKAKMQELIKQDGIEFVGRLSYDEMCKMYWKSEYWCLPLNNPDSELFCINAIKAQYCGAIPVVRRIGALQETVNEFIDWDSILGQKVGKSTFSKDSIENNRLHSEKFSLKTAVQKWNEVIKR